MQGCHSMSRFLTRRLLFATVALLSVAASATAQPSELRGKSVLIHWAEGRSQKFPDGTTAHRVLHANFVMYVSEAGRVFMQSARHVVNRRGKAVVSAGRSKGPGGDEIKTANVRYSAKGQWKGQTYTSVVNYQSGARRLVLTFDPGFGSCKLELTHGKEEGAPGMVHHGMTGRLMMTTKVDVSGQTCSVRAGNALAE
jgi:hypothetical protein